MKPISATLKTRRAAAAWAALACGALAAGTAASADAGTPVGLALPSAAGNALGVAVASGGAQACTTAAVVVPICGGTPGNSGGTPSNSGAADDAHSLPKPARPVLGTSVELGAPAGAVTVRLPGAAQAVPLAAGASVPVGSTIDATHGVVTLTSVKTAAGADQTGQFWGGAFRVEQTRSTHPVTVLVLDDSSLGSCGALARRAAVTSAGRGRSLWGRDSHGSFRTRGRGGVAVVRGTVWLTQDSCAGTLVRVRRGAVLVRDFARHKGVLVHAGGSYLARTHWRGKSA